MNFHVPRIHFHQFFSLQIHLTAIKEKNDQNKAEVSDQGRGGGGDGFFLVIGQRGCAVRWGRIMIVLRFQEEWLDETPNIN